MVLPYCAQVLLHAGSTSGTVEAAVATAPSVIVRDAKHEAVSGVVVAFAVTAGPAALMTASTGSATGAVGAQVAEPASAATASTAHKAASVMLVPDSASAKAGVRAPETVHRTLPTAAAPAKHR